MSQEQAPTPKIADILIVDDTLVMIKILSKKLLGAGYKVRAARTGELALEGARAKPPDLMLLDINLPGLSGYEVCELLKQDAALRHIPVIFISAMDDVIDKVQAFEVGGVDYLTKPVQMQEALARINTHLELSRLRADLERENRLKDRFMQAANHDLRNSVRAILGFTALIERAGEDDWRRIQNSLHKIESAGNHMLDIIKVFLDYRQTARGGLQLVWNACRIADIVAEVCVEIGVLAEEKGLALQQFFEDEGRTVLADSGRLRQALMNLMANAVKFSPEGGMVEVETYEIGDRIRIEVRDQGPGVPLEERRYLFQEFSPLAAGNTEQGFGLGLWIVKRLVQAHGGEVGADFPNGCGSIFWLEIPARPPSSMA